jgi:hypothetical protein
MLLAFLLSVSGFWLRSERVTFFGASPVEFLVTYFAVFSAIWGAIATILAVLRDR